MIASIIDFISPRACRCCGTRLSITEQEICSVCHWHMPRTEYWNCPYDNNLSRRFWGRFEVTKAASLYFYEAKGTHARLIHDLKYYGRKHVGEWLGRTAAEEMAPSGFFEDIDILVPVPITWRRKWHRGYNQSEVIARAVAEVTALPVCSNALRRTHFHRSQTTLSTPERIENVEEAFSLRHPESIEGLHVLLIDDIVTTGATVASCAKELFKAGNVRVSVMSIGCTKI